MTVDTSSEAVERFSAKWEAAFGNSDFPNILRALAKERDAARNALQYILDGHVGNAMDDVTSVSGYTPAQQRAIFENIGEAARLGLAGTFKTPDLFRKGQSS